jgi:phosphomannomutase/phosphoglucomutase
MLPKEIFRQYDIRGTVPDTFNKNIACNIANVFGYQIKEKTKKDTPIVTVGRDVRLSSDEIFQGVLKGLTDSGCEVIELGHCPTPVTYFSAFHLNPDAYLMITGSHNPANYNGMKLGIGKSTYHSELITSLFDDFQKYGYRTETNKGKHSTFDIKKEYIKWNLNHFSELKNKIKNLKRRITVVIDAGNGVASDVAPEIFKGLGVNVVELFCEFDGNFPNHHPDPTVEENLIDAKNKLNETGADFAVAYDGDADRIGVVDERQNVIWGDMLILIFAKEIAKTKKNPTVIADVKASQVLFDELSKNKINGIMWKTGHSLIKSKLKETNAELAGEMSGHIFFADKYFGYDDAIYSSVRFLEAYVNEIIEGKVTKVSDLLKNVPKVYNTPEIRFDCEESKKFQIVEKLSEIFRNYKENGKYGIKDIITIDGIRVVFENGWGLLRASNTQPVLVMRFEATDEKSMNSYKELFENELQKL